MGGGNPGCRDQGRLAHGKCECPLLTAGAERHMSASAREEIAYDLEISKAMIEPTYQQCRRNWAFFQSILVLLQLES